MRASLKGGQVDIYARLDPGRRSCRALVLGMALALANASGCSGHECTIEHPPGTDPSEPGLDCNGTCTPLWKFDVDPQNCGDCRNACPSGRFCWFGVCKECIVCDLRCIDPLTDFHFCGASGDCSGSNAGTNCGLCECVQGSCASPPPDTGRILCGQDGCVDPKTDRLHCGASGDCLGPNSGLVCSGAYYECVGGFCRP
jgi:hypothetical protein